MENEKIEDLFPNLTLEERALAEESLDRYLALAWEIWEELRERKSPG